MEAFTELIDTKLSKLRESLLREFKSALDTYVEEKKEELKVFVVAEREKNLDIPSELSESIKEIQKHIISLKADNIILKNRVDDLQQYIRRQNVRIFGVPVNKRETKDEIENLVKEMITDHGISEYSLDRAHRIGKIKKLVTDSETIEVQPIIARFTTFRDWTTLYSKAI